MQLNHQESHLNLKELRSIVASFNEYFVGLLNLQDMDRHYQKNIARTAVLFESRPPVPSRLTKRTPCRGCAGSSAAVVEPENHPLLGSFGGQKQTQYTSATGWRDIT